MMASSGSRTGCLTEASTRCASWLRAGGAWWEPGDGRPLIPFGLDQLEDPAFRQYRALAITEGESDALALSATFGAEGLDVLGAPGATTWRPAWAQYARAYEAVYVLGDGDDAGRRFNQRVAHDVPAATVVWLPEGEDVRAIVQRDPGELAELLTEADWYRRVLADARILKAAA
jgi:5S rRNA maturation endonuclease (ribonuclease M5)